VSAAADTSGPCVHHRPPAASQAQSSDMIVVPRDGLFPRTGRASGPGALLTKACA